MNQSKLDINTITVEPPVSDHQKCGLGGLGRGSLTRSEFCFLAYRKYRNSPQVWKVKFEKKSSSSHWEISDSWTTQKDNLQRFYPFYALLQVHLSNARLLEVKNKMKFFQTSNFKLCCLREVAAHKKVRSTVIWLGSFCILENRSLRRGGRLREVVAVRGSTVVDAELSWLFR